MRLLPCGFIQWFTENLEINVTKLTLKPRLGNTTSEYLALSLYTNAVCYQFKAD